MTCNFGTRDIIPCSSPFLATSANYTTCDSNHRSLVSFSFTFTLNNSNWILNLEIRQAGIVILSKTNGAQHRKRRRAIHKFEYYIYILHILMVFNKSNERLDLSTLATKYTLYSICVYRMLKNIEPFWLICSK